MAPGGAWRPPAAQVARALLRRCQQEVLGVRLAEQVVRGVRRQILPSHSRELRNEERGLQEVLGVRQAEQVCIVGFGSCAFVQAAGDAWRPPGRASRACLASCRIAS